MDCDELYVSFLFPPGDYVSGITVFKRIVDNNHKVDVLQSKIDSLEDSTFNRYVNEYISNRIEVGVDYKYDWTNFIFDFIKKGMDAIKKDYGKIYSRSWLMANHFLAYEYKLKHNDVKWTAEFSDPLIYDLNNEIKTYKEMIIDDEEYISKINDQITILNENTGNDFKLIENNSSCYFIAEYIVYLFADNIIFTNENQQNIMLNQFPVNVKDFVLAKSEIKMHPTLDNKYYTIEDVDLDLSEDYINMAYFGKDYYSQRNFESLFYAVEALNHKFKDKIRVYLFISNKNLVKKLLPSERFIVKKPLDYLKFLNATTKFDVLLVNDVTTNGNFDVNPYLPSKLSDYMGSGSDIWALYEKNSTLSKFDLKYKSDMSDYDSCLEVMVQILKDHGFDDENYSINQNYLNKRLTYLNETIEKEFKQKTDFKRKYKKLKKENSNSNSWNLTKSLRKLKK